MPIPPNYDKLDIFYQCPVQGCNARCAVSPKESGRLGDHWKKAHADHGRWDGKNALVKTRNEDGSLTTLTFGAYCIVNCINYRSQDSPRPSRHGQSTSSHIGPHSAATSTLPQYSSPLTRSVTTPATAPTSAAAFSTVNFRRNTNIGTVPPSAPPSRLRPASSVQSSSSAVVPAKRSITQLLNDTRPDRPRPTTTTATTGNRLPFSQLLIEHLVPPRSPSPPPRYPVALTLTQALRGVVDVPPHVNNGQKKDYSDSVWTCHMCHIDFPNMDAIKRHLRDHHYVESDIATLTPDCDVITLVMASVKREDKDAAEEEREGEGSANGEDDDDNTPLWERKIKRDKAIAAEKEKGGKKRVRFGEGEKEDDKEGGEEKAAAVEPEKKKIRLRLRIGPPAGASAGAGVAAATENV